jgi:hypothetical protein
VNFGEKSNFHGRNWSKKIWGKCLTSSEKFFSGCNPTSTQKFFSGCEFSRGVAWAKINCSNLLKIGGSISYILTKKIFKKIKKTY